MATLHVSSDVFFPDTEHRKWFHSTVSKNGYTVVLVSYY